MRPWQSVNAGCAGPLRAGRPQPPATKCLWMVCWHFASVRERDGFAADKTGMFLAVLGVRAGSVRCSSSLHESLYERVEECTGENPRAGAVCVGVE